MKVKYTVLDPTGNITILVTTPVDISKQPYVASHLMKLLPEAEQVGFLSEAADCDIALRMAGGEFCGNASMSAAAYYVNATGLQQCPVLLRVSGADGLVTAEISPLEEGKWRGTVDMPHPQKQEYVMLPGAGRLPVVSFDGISHVIYEVNITNTAGVSNPDVNSNGPDDTASSIADMAEKSELPETASSELPVSRAAAEALAVEWCRYLGADALGIMFLDLSASSMTPLVYVPAAGTLFWENSCASGTTACGAYAAAKSGGSCEISLRQPGGSLEIKVTPDGQYLLTGTVLFKFSGSVAIPL